MKSAIHKLNNYASRLEELKASTQECEAFSNYFIGSIAHSVPEEEWETCLELATKYICKNREEHGVKSGQEL